MQASLARWAVVTFCTLGAVGCQGTKPGWWPGNKAPVYSQSSTTPPAGLPQQYSQQQQAYPQQQQQQGYPQTPGYMDAASAQGAQTGYQTAGAYPIGNGNSQDAYASAATGTTPYDHGYAQQQQQAAGAYPEQFQTGAGVTQAGGAVGGYQGGYPQTNGYQQTGVNGYGAADPAAGYEQTRTADARYQTGGTQPYGTNSPYDPSGSNGGYSPQDPYGQGGAAAGYQQAPAQTEPQYQPGTTNYQPGNTGYAPPGTAPYQSPAGPYSPDPNATSQADPHYRPGSTGDYSPAGNATATAATTGFGAAPATSNAAPLTGAAPRYPQTSTGTATDSYQSQPADRYGRTQDAASGYPGGIQR